MKMVLTWMTTYLILLFNLIVEAGQVAGALVILEALPPQANAQSIPSVTSAGD